MASLADDDTRTFPGSASVRTWEEGVNDPTRRLEGFRAYLGLLARTRLGPNLERRVGASDVVQQSLLDAHRNWEDFRGNSDGELAAWLRAILAANVADAIRAAHRAKRDIDRELVLRDFERSGTRLEACLAAVQTSPSQHAARNDELLRLSDALDQLPDDQRVAVELHHLQGLTLGETSDVMNRTDASVAGLLRRGLRRLRELLNDGEVGP